MHVFNRLKIHHHISAKTLLCLTFRAVKCITSCNPLYQTFKLSYTRDLKVDNLYSLIKHNISAFKHVLYLCWYKSFNCSENKRRVDSFSTPGPLRLNGEKPGNEVLFHHYVPLRSWYPRILRNVLDDQAC